MSYKISIIVPVYNAENELEKCISSVINQTFGFENIELILVDDNSHDNSKGVIQKYCSDYDNIKGIFLNENHGFPGFGRNTGIEAATSPYLMFMDNDDEIDCEMCEKLYDAITSYDADIVHCNHIHKDEINTIYFKIPAGEKEFDTFENEEIVQHISTFIWDKIYKREIIIQENIRFMESSFAEDDLFGIEYCLNSKKMIKLNDFYGYIYYGSHLSSSAETISDKITVTYKVYELFKKYNVKFNLSNYFNANISMIIGMIINKQNASLKEISDIIKKLYSFEKEINFNNDYIKIPFIKFINNLILKKHFVVAKFMVYLLNKLKNFKIFTKIYRSKYS